MALIVLMEDDAATRTLVASVLRKDGHEVLAEMRADPKLKLVPVVVLTTSNAATDVARSYELHANCHVRKPVDYAEFIQTLRCIERYWLGTATLPTAFRPKTTG